MMAVHLFSPWFLNYPKDCSSVMQHLLQMIVPESWMKWSKAVEEWAHMTMWCSTMWLFRNQVVVESTTSNSSLHTELLITKSECVLEAYDHYWRLIVNSVVMVDCVHALPVHSQLDLAIALLRNPANLRTLWPTVQISNDATDSWFVVVIRNFNLVREFWINLAVQYTVFPLISLENPDFWRIYDLISRFYNLLIQDRRSDVITLEW